MLHCQHVAVQLRHPLHQMSTFRAQTTSMTEVSCIWLLQHKLAKVWFHPVSLHGLCASACSGQGSHHHGDRPHHDIHTGLLACISSSHDFPFRISYTSPTINPSFGVSRSLLQLTLAAPATTQGGYPCTRSVKRGMVQHREKDVMRTGAA